MDKNRAIVDFLLNCPIIQQNPLFFNFAQVESGNNHIITEQDIKKKQYIDGSVLKQYTFSIASYSSVSHNAIVNGETVADENIDNMAKVQQILDWIDEQADNHNYPNFGPEYVIDDMSTLVSDPDVDGIDTSVNPPIARYSIGVKIEYLDNSKKISS